MLRSSYIRGPAYVNLGGRVFLTKSDVSVRYDLGIFEPESEIYGPLTPRVSERIAEVSFTPIGTFSVDDIHALCPLAGFSDFIGGSIFGDSASGGSGTWVDGTRAGRSLYIQGRDGEKLTWTKGAAVSKMPDLTFSATKTILGGVTLVALGDADGSASGWTDDWMTASSGQSWAPSGTLTPYTQPYSVAVSGGTWADNFGAIETVDGVTFSMNASVDPHGSDTYGRVDMTWGGFEVTARFTPANISAMNLANTLLNKLWGTGAVSRGSVVPPAAAGTAFVVQGIGSGAGIKAVMANPAIVDAGLMFSNKSPRVSEIQLRFSRFTTSDVPITLTGLE